MEIKKSEECRFWMTFEGTAHLGVCSNVAIHTDPRYEPEEIPDDGVLATDDEGIGIMTGPEFGCVHYTAKRVI